MKKKNNESLDFMRQALSWTTTDYEMRDALSNFNRTLLSGIPERLFDALTPYFEEKKFEKGECLIRQGERGDCIFVLISGEVKIFSVDPAGNDHLIDNSGPGEVLGEMALLTGEPRSATVIADTPVRALSLAADSFHELAKEHVELSKILTNIVAKRLGAVEYDALAGKVLGGYLLTRRLGKGGMAVVYQADDPANNRQIALKMMSHRLVYDKSAIQQFDREFELVRKFFSQYIVQTFSRFEAFNTVFLVMEHCDGRSLDEVVLDGPAGETKIRRVYESLRCALEYAHKRGVIHRDIKPSNLIELLNGQVKLMDFGLAVPIDELENEKGISGTASYLAPELLNKQPASYESDYFAAGMLLAELTLGRRIVKGTSFRQVVNHLKNWDPPNIAALCPRITPVLADQIQCLIDVNPAKRVFNELS